MMLPSNYDYIDTLIERYNEEKDEALTVHEYMSKLGETVLRNVFETSRYSFLRKDDEMKHRLKRNYWLEVYNRSNLSDIISSKEQTKILKNLDDVNIPEFTRENIESTIESWIGNAYRLFSEKVDSIFERLSGDHITNQPHGFTKKIIYKNLVSYTWFTSTFNMYMFSDYGLDVIHDLRTAIQVLYKLPISTKHDTKLILQTINERNEYTSFDHGAFKVKIFKNGNAHIELHPHVAILLNCELAKLYPTAIPPKHRTSTPEIKEYNFEYRHLSEKLKTSLREFVMYSKMYPVNGTYEIKFSRRHYVDNFTKEVLDFIGIEQIEEHVLYKCDFNPIEAIRHVIVNGTVEYKSNQYYPTPDNIVNDIVYHVGDVSDKKILEPSAGRGNIANRFEDIHCIDKEELNTIILKNKHKNVVHGDFLFYDVKKESDKYDIIVMNPPYNKKQWFTHVDHALKLLKTDGIIYAVLPSGKTESFENCELLETYHNEFEKTGITTCLYKITN